MTFLRRAKERRHDRRRKQDVWLTFDPQESVDALPGGFGTLESLNEVHLSPGAGVVHHPLRDAELVTYVREGGLAFDDSEGGGGIIQAGEYRCMTARRASHHSEKNASRAEEVSFFQIWLRRSLVGLCPRQEQKRFSTGERRGALRVVASPDARKGSLRIHQEVVICSALLDPGQHVVHELRAGRGAWLHVVRGEATLGDTVMTTGDGAGVTDERALSLTAREETELLLIDLGDVPLPPGLV